MHENVPAPPTNVVALRVKLEELFKRLDEAPLGTGATAAVTVEIVTTSRALAVALDDYEQEACDIIQGAYDDVDKHRAELMRKARTSGCVYCGEIIEGGIEHAEPVREQLFRQHAAVCPRHPMRDAEKERDAFAKLLREGISMWGDGWISRVKFALNMESD